MGRLTSTVAKSPAAVKTKQQKLYAENTLGFWNSELDATVNSLPGTAAQFGHSLHHTLGIGSLAHAAPVQAKTTDDHEHVAFQTGASGSGRSMPQPVQQKMEAAFGTSFANVRIHETPQAKAIGALAYTQGSDIHFAPGQYDPLSEAGQALLGHELTHVIQQRAGRVAKPGGSSVPINADPGLEAEADRMGARAAQGQMAHVGSGLFGDGLVAPSAEPAPVQCFFKKIGRGLKKMGKGIGKGIKTIGKKAIDIAPSLYDFGLDVASAIPGIGQYANGARALLGTDNSFISSLVKGGDFGDALSTSAGSFLGGLNMPGMPGGGMDVMSMLGGSGGGGMDFMSMFGGMGGGQSNNIMSAVGSGSDLLKDLFD